MNTIGIPFTPLKDDRGYVLTFNGWSLDFNVGNYQGDNGNDSVTGNFPYANSSVNLMYFNLSLESIFNDMYQDENYPKENSNSNALDIYVFPIYTTGKDYVDSESIRSANDAFQIVPNGNALEKANYFNQDKNLQESLNEQGMEEVRVYSYNTYSLEDISESLEFRFAKYSWGNWETIQLTDGKTNFLEQEALTIINDEGKRVGAGIYNIHVFYKEWYSYQIGEGSFSDNEIEKFDQLLESRNIQRYCSFQSSRIRVKEISWGIYLYANFYIVFERQFEPQLIGGPTQSLSPQISSNEWQFNRDINNHNVYVLNNIRFNVETETDWYSYFADSNYQLSNIVFGIQLDRNESFNMGLTYNIGIAGTLTGYEDYNFANFFSKLSDTNNFKDAIRNVKNPDQEINVSEITGYQDNLANLFRINEKVEQPVNNEEKARGYGIYSLAIRINYDTITPGDFAVHKPASIDVFAYRQHNIYIAIYDVSDSFHADEILTIDNGRTFVQPKIVYDSTSSYSFIASNLYLDTLLDGQEIFLNTKNTALGIGNSLSLSEIIEYYENNGYEIYDRVSGQIIHLESLRLYPFRIMKNYIFHVRRK